MPHLDALRYIAFENIVRKGEIACNKQFLLFSQCFLPYMALIFHFKCTFKCCLQFVSIWTSLKFCRLVMSKLITTQSQLLAPLEKRALENIVGKGENAGSQHFFLFPPYFLPFLAQISILSHDYVVVCKCFEFRLM